VRDATGASVLRHLFPQGETLLVAGNGSNYYYTRDCLGSVREALDANAMLLTRYDYDPYGQQAFIQENVKTTFAYTGHFVHAPSGLYLSLFRPLNSGSGRWLSRDPLGESLELNLYAYVGNDPINSRDALGMCTDESGDENNPDDNDPSENIKHFVDALDAGTASGNAVLLAAGMDEHNIPGLNFISASIAANNFAQNPNVVNGVEYVASLSGLFPPNSPAGAFGFGVTLGEAATRAAYVGSVYTFGQGNVDEVLAATGRGLGF
jgi:RHS repeat-associated protein